MDSIYNAIKETHYILMILLLVSLMFTSAKFYLNAKNEQPFEGFEDKQSLGVMVLAHIQLLLGLIMLFTGPLSNHFSNMGGVMKHSDLRFSIIEHPVAMIIGVALITIGRIASKKKPTDAKKFMTIAIYYAIALIVFAIRIPWDKLNG